MILMLLLLAQDLSQQGAAAMKTGRFVEAEKIYRTLATQAPNQPQWRMNLGLALHSSGKYAEALRAFDIYLAKVPQPGPIHFVKGIDHLKLNAPCKAVAPLEKARQWQASKQVFTALADAYSGCKRYAEAAGILETLPDPRGAARAYWQARDYPNAKRVFAQITGPQTDDPQFQYELGDTLYRLEGAGPALPHLKKAIAILPARGMLGRALLDLDKPGEALPHLEAASQIDPALLLPLSRALKATGRAEDAARIEADYRKKLGNQN